MPVLSVENLSKSYGVRTLFTGISFGLEQGQKVALIAANGTGKSTLLRIIAGLDIADEGKVVIANGVTIAYLEQEPHLPEGHTVSDLIFYKDQPAIRALRRYELAVENSTQNPGPASEAELSAAMQEADALNIWEYEHKAHEILDKLEVNFLGRRIETLSGGQRKRVALARLLVNNPDVLILDEPTNHIDLEMVEWLEDYLGRMNATLLLVTHDRYFLDRITDEILELEDGRIYRYKGNYAYFLEKKQERMETATSEVEKARNLMRTELEWIRRQPKARGTKAKARIDAFDTLKEKAAGRVAAKDISIDLKMNRIGGKVMELKNLTHRFGDLPILKNFTYTFRKGERVGIVGKNGSGKSTFLKIITGLISPDAGTVVVGDTIVFGYYTQEGMKLDESKRVIDAVREIAEYVPLGKEGAVTAVQLLTRFNFPPQRQYDFISKLSGGERRRLYLLIILMRNPNFLILDEPTNDLDLPTLQVLEEFLDSYGGCLIIVSHDRYFLNRLCEHLFVFEGNGQVKDYNGTWLEYRDERDSKEAEETAMQTKETKVVKNDYTAGDKPRKLSFKEQHELEALTEEIAQIQQSIHHLTEKLSRGEGSYEQIAEWGTALENAKTLLDEKEMRWLELEELR